MEIFLEINCRPSLESLCCEIFSVQRSVEGQIREVLLFVESIETVGTRHAPGPKLSASLLLDLGRSRARARCMPS